MLELFEEYRGDLAMKFCEKVKYCLDLARGNVYMKENAYFRRLEDNYRGDFADGRMVTSWKGNVVPITFSDGETINTQTINDTIYGMGNDDKIPVFCASVFDGAILERPASPLFFMQHFIEEVSKFGDYAVCFSIKEFVSRVKDYVKQKEWQFMYGKVFYCEKNAFFYSHRDEPESPNNAFPKAWFEKDYSYRWQNEWRGILLNRGNTIIPFSRDFHVMELKPLESAFICKTEHIVNAKLVPGQKR